MERVKVSIIDWRVTQINIQPYSLISLEADSFAQPKGIIEASLDKDWSGPEEDEAWKDL